MKRVSKKGENVMRKRYGWLVILVMGMVVCGATSFLKAHEETPCFTIQLWKNYETKDPIVKQKVTLQYEEEETLQTFTQLSNEDGKVVFLSMMQQWKKVWKFWFLSIMMSKKKQ